jgi:lysophospholipase L1-like esterase
MYKFLISCFILIISIAFICNSCSHVYREGLRSSTHINNKTIVMLGDSMLENANYVNKDRSVTELVKNYVEAKDYNFYNFAKDGETIPTVSHKIARLTSNQIQKLNKRTTHIFLSVGGNDILKLNQPLEASVIVSTFLKYIELIKLIKSRFPNAKLTVLNLYTPTASWIEIYRISIKQWNEALEQKKTKYNYGIIDVNKLLFDKQDFTHDIEPSVIGGQKIVNEIIMKI